MVKPEWLTFLHNERTACLSYAKTPQIANPDMNDVALDDLIVPDRVETRQAAFSAIMAEP